MGKGWVLFGNVIQAGATINQIFMKVDTTVVDGARAASADRPLLRGHLGRHRAQGHPWSSTAHSMSHTSMLLFQVRAATETTRYA